MTPPSQRTKISRLAKRGHYSSDIIYPILDEALWGTVAYVEDGSPRQIPTGIVRIDHTLFIHGSVGSHFLRQIADGREVCLSATLMDGIVLAKSAFNHSVNYRSVVVFSRGVVVVEEPTKMQVLEAFTNKMEPGRWEVARIPSASELEKTMVIGFDVSEASAKVRTGAPIDDDADQHLSIPTGVIPLVLERKDLLPGE
jgi:uncharacterized protein